MEFEVSEHEAIDSGEPASGARFDLLGLPVDSQGLRIPADLDQAAQTTGTFIATFVNPYAYYLAKQDSGFVELLRQFDRISSHDHG